MQEINRRFQTGPDPFGRTWEVEFRWLQNGISIRHSDSVDAKFVMWTQGEEPTEKIIALPHLALLDLAKKTGHALTDPWCLKLAARHVRYMVQSGEDLDKTIVTLAPQELARAAGILKAA
jgi:hypothetical protein